MTAQGLSWQSDSVRGRGVEDAAQHRQIAHYRADGWPVTDTRYGDSLSRHCPARGRGGVPGRPGDRDRRSGRPCRERDGWKYARAPGRSVMVVLSAVRLVLTDKWALSLARSGACGSCVGTTRSRRSASSGPRTRSKLLILATITQSSHWSTSCVHHGVPLQARDSGLRICTYLARSRSGTMKRPSELGKRWCP